VVIAQVEFNMNRWIVGFFAVLFFVIVAAFVLELRRTPSARQPANDRSALQTASAEALRQEQERSTAPTGTVQAPAATESAATINTPTPDEAVTAPTDLLTCSDPFDDARVQSLVAQLESYSPKTRGGKSLTASELAAPDVVALNTVLSRFVTTKRGEFFKLKDKPGNSECYFHLGRLFLLDFKRISTISDFSERAQLLTLTYEPTDSNRVLRGYVDIMKYFFEKYIRLEPDGRYAEPARAIRRQLFRD